MRGAAASWPHNDLIRPTPAAARGACAGASPDRAYGARPAFAHARLAWTDDGRISYRLKRPWPDGRTHLVLEPVAFLRRLVGIIPPPRRHLVRYAGVFGPAAKARSQLRALIPAVGADDAASSRCPASELPIPLRARRLPWADLLRRVFAEDILACPCGGRRSVTAFVTDQRLASSLLAALGLTTEPAAFAPARAPPRRGRLRAQCLRHGLHRGHFARLAAGKRRR